MSKQEKLQRMLNVRKKNHTFTMRLNICVTSVIHPCVLRMFYTHVFYVCSQTYVLRTLETCTETYGLRTYKKVMRFTFLTMFSNY